MNWVQRLAIAGMAVALNGCGGGGGSASTSSPTAPSPAPATPAPAPAPAPQLLSTADTTLAGDHCSDGDAGGWCLIAIGRYSHSAGVFDLGTEQIGLGVRDGFLYKTLDGAITWQRVGKWMPVNASRVAMSGSEWALVSDGTEKFFRVDVTSGDYEAVKLPDGFSSVVPRYGTTLTAARVLNSTATGYEFTSSSDGGRTWSQRIRLDVTLRQPRDGTVVNQVVEDYVALDGSIFGLNAGTLARFTPGSSTPDYKIAQPKQCNDLWQNGIDIANTPIGLTGTTDSFVAIAFRIDAKTRYCVWSVNDATWKLAPLLIEMEKSTWAPDFATDGSILQQTPGAIFILNRGNQSWKMIPYPQDFAEQSSALDLNNFFGIAGSGRIWRIKYTNVGGSNVAQYFTSTDEGQSWSPVDEAAWRAFTGRFAPTSVQTKSIGSAVRVRPDSVSSDGGASWRTVNLPIEPGLSLTPGWFDSGAFFDSRRGFVLGGTEIFYTDDGAKTWKVPAEHPVGSPIEILFRDSETAWILTGPSIDQTLYVTQDAGATWKQVGRFPGKSGTSSLSGRIKGPWIFLRGDKLQITYDYGRTWTNLTYPPSTTYSIAALDKKTFAALDGFSCIRFSRDEGQTWGGCETTALKDAPFAQQSLILAGNDLWFNGDLSAVAAWSTLGKTWSLVKFPETSVDFGFLNERQIFILSGTSSYRSSDGGMSWEYRGRLPTERKYPMVGSLSPIDGARQIVVTAGRVYATTTAGDPRH